MVYHYQVRMSSAWAGPGRAAVACGNEARHVHGGVPGELGDSCGEGHDARRPRPPGAMRTSWPAEPWGQRRSACTPGGARPARGGCREHHGLGGREIRTWSTGAPRSAATAPAPYGDNTPRMSRHAHRGSRLQPAEVPGMHEQLE